jgi:fatty-acyl-CoA synthase
MRSTMQEVPLLISHILRHGQDVHGDSEVVTVMADGYRSSTYTEVGAQAEKLAKALGKLGVGPGDRVGTFTWNNQEHLAAYLGIPSMGAVLHTLNIRLFPEQLSYVANHAEDKVIIADASVLPQLAAVWDDLKTVEHLIVIGEGETERFGETLSFDELLGAEEPGYDWPELDERDAAAMCYTSGTTGNPKGVVYSHRSTFLHTMAHVSASSIGMTEADRLLVIVPMFHANAWGTPYSCWMVGADIVMPQSYVQGERLLRIIEDQRITLSCGVPTVWNDMLRALSNNPGADLSSLVSVTAGGSAVPRALFEAFASRVGAEMVQGWGMTETSPLAAFGRPPDGCPADQVLEYRTKAGRIVPAVEVRVVDDDGTVMPNDGESVGEFEIRGPWVTASYYKDDDPHRFHDGWLCTGDVGSLDGRGYMTISDRTKDVIKSGGEWISSVDLEGQVMSHPDVFEAAVIAVPDERWDERPLVCVVANEGATLDAAALQKFLVGKVARWAMPERWTIIDTVPKTSVGKFDKKVLRAAYADGQLDVVTLGRPPG